MATSVVPALIDALVAAATTALPNAHVSDGFGRSNDIGDQLMIGVDDPDSTSAAFTSDSSQTQATAGTPRSRNQAGSITCAALASDGDSDQKVARDAAYAMQAAVETLLRTDPTLGIPRPNGQVLVIQIGDERLSQNQYDEGCDALLIFTVNFEARI